MPRYYGLSPDLIWLPKECILQDVINGLENENCQPDENDLIDFVFGKPFLNDTSLNKAILCPLNEDSLKLNELILKKLKGIKNLKFTIGVRIKDKT